MSYNHDKITQKLNDLYWKVHNGPPKDKDLIWCKNLLSDVKDSGLVPNKEEFNMANLMWKKYSDGVSTDDKVMWSLIDMLLTQDNPTKIGAIKIYRKYIECSLREAKEMVDAREIKIKKEW